MWFSWIWYTYRDGYYQNDLNRSVSFYWTPTYWVAFTVFYTLTTTGSSRDCMVKYWATFVQVAGNQLLISIEYTCSNFDDANWWQQTVVSCIKTGLGWWNGLALVQQWPNYKLTTLDLILNWHLSKICRIIIVVPVNSQAFCI